MSKITVDVVALRDVVSTAEQFVGKKREGGAAMLRFVEDKQMLSISAVGAESQLLVQRLPCVKTRLSSFEVLVPPKRLLQILQTLREQTVEINADRASVTVSTSSSKFRLATESFDTFPVIDQIVPDHSQADIVVSELVASLQHTVPLCDEASVRYALGGVLFEMSQDGSHIVSTDSRRLMVSRRQGLRIVGPEVKFIMPSAMAKSVLMLLKRHDQQKTIRLFVNHNRMAITGEEFSLVTPGVEGRFPAWRNLMAAANCQLVLVATAGDIKRACRLANVMTYCIMPLVSER